MDFTSFGPKKAAGLSTPERGQGDAGQQTSRRHFLTITVAALGGLLIYSPEKGFFQLQDEKKILHIPLHFFEGSEAQIVTAAVSRIFPTDDSGPGAKETGVAIYIDRHLAGPYGSDRHRYTPGPFESGRPELGYQGKATPREIYREGLKGLAGFQHLQIAEQDRALKEIESSLLFSLLRQHTLEGMFSDPIHGGNLAMRGWQLIGFPGPQMNNYDDVDKHFGEAFRPPPVSLSSGRVSSENEE
jgi:gluconate 2-dehydrogenase gamma chain